jgi:hypothetical protein
MKLFAMVGLAAAFTLSAVAVGQAAVTSNEKIPFSLVAFVPCANDGAGEFVLVEGTLHVLTTFTINDNNVSGKVHFQPQGATGVGLTTGDTYHATGVTQEHFKGSLQNGQFNDTFINNFRIIGPGPNNNLLVHQTIHITINANGEVTSTVDNTSVECS